jgi:hypothetical protein
VPDSEPVASSVPLASASQMLNRDEQEVNDVMDDLYKHTKVFMP